MFKYQHPHISNSDYECLAPLAGEEAPIFLPVGLRFYYDETTQDLHRRVSVQRYRVKYETSVRVANSVTVKAQGRTGDGKYLMYLNVRDASGEWQEIAVPFATAGSKASIKAIREAGGVVYPDAEKHLIAMLKASNPPMRIMLPETANEDAPIVGGRITIYHADQYDGDWNEPDAPR